MPKKITTEEFIKRSKEIHGDKFLYDKVEYKSSWEKVLIGCREHGYFLQAPANHLYGAKCLRCRQERTGRANAMSQEEFINRSNEIHNKRYDYSKVEYTGCFDSVEIICYQHGSFFQIPNTHLTNHGCPRCGREKANELTRKTQQQFIEDAHKTHGDIYDYSLVRYESSHTKIKIICRTHGIFEQKPGSHLTGQGCPICKKSKGELKIFWFLTKQGIIFETEKVFPECKNKNSLPFDFFFTINNKSFLIEYDGSQHFYGWKNKSTLPRIKKSDSIKTKFAHDNDFVLIRIPYTEFDNIETILKAEIEKYF